MESYAIADCAAVPDEEFYARVEELVGAGVDWIQLRARSLDDRAVFDIGRKMRELIGGTTELLVNGRADLARAVEARGVHLPANGMPASAARAVGTSLIVGRSCHSLEDCRQARDEGIDYVVLGPVFDPRSKPGTGAISFAELEAAAGLGLRVFALGGISRERLPELRRLKLAGVAAVTLFMKDSAVEEAVRMVREL